MKKSTRAIFLLIVVISATGLVFAQAVTPGISASDKYLISAKAGGVNFAEGEVNRTLTNGKSRLLLKGDNIEIGDRVSTGLNGRIEILLNPGSYLRLGGNSSLEFESTALDDLQIKIISGSAMFEVFATDQFRVNISTPNEKLAFFESGVYRIDLRPDGSGDIRVTEGKAAVGRIGNLKLVTTGKMALFGDGTVTIAKFNRDKRDELADWSKTRAKNLAKLTASLRNSNVRNSLLSSFNGGRWNMYDSFGLWIMDPISRMFCFMPFGQGWYSPYGYGYRTWVYDLIPSYLPRPPINPPVDPFDLSRRRPVDDSTVPPPFTAIERQQKDAQRRTPADDRGSNPGGDRRYSPANERNSPDVQRSSGSPQVSHPPSPAPARTDSPARQSSPIDH